MFLVKCPIFSSFDISLNDCVGINDCCGATLLDVSKVKSMYGMFNGAYKFEGKGLDMWKTNSVTDTQWMFYGDEYGNKGYSFDADLSGKCRSCLLSTISEMNNKLWVE